MKLRKKKVCWTCRHHRISGTLYRDVCKINGEDPETELIIPDSVLNWIKIFGCDSWKKVKEYGGE